MLVRIAALVAVDAPPVSYLLNLGAAAELDVDRGRDPWRPRGDRTDRRHAAVVAAAGNIVRALGIALDLAELEGEVDGRDADAVTAARPAAPEEHRP